MAANWHLEHFYHTVINVRDLDESVVFYRLLGFEVLNDRRHVEWPDFVAGIFGMKRAKGRGVLMVLPSDPDGPMIDLIEWVEPEAKFDSIPDPCVSHQGRSRSPRCAHREWRALHAKGFRAPSRPWNHRFVLLLRSQRQFDRTYRTQPGPAP
jgi:hypothetical protein